MRKRTMKAGVVYPQIELGGDTGAVKAFAQAPGATDRFDPQAVARACGRIRGLGPPDRQSRYIAAAEAANSDLAGWLERGRVRPSGQNRRRISVRRPNPNPGCRNQGEDRSQ